MVSAPTLLLSPLNIMMKSLPAPALIESLPPRPASRSLKALPVSMLARSSSLTVPALSPMRNLPPSGKVKFASMKRSGFSSCSTMIRWSVANATLLSPPLSGRLICASERISDPLKSSTSFDGSNGRKEKTGRLL